jgi:predicted amidophosphoribosyltransferase
VRALRRVRYTAAQAGLSNTGRRENVAGAFVPRRRATVRGMRVLLVDDVMTTGATATACAAALKRAGARSVALLTLARADRRHPSRQLQTHTEGVS